MPVLEMELQSCQNVWFIHPKQKIKGILIGMVVALPWRDGD